LNPGQPGVPLKAKSLTRAVTRLYRCSTYSGSSTDLAELRALRLDAQRVLKKNSGLFGLGASASSNKLSDLVTMDELAARPR
jgi:hypothetical protein